MGLLISLGVLMTPQLHFLVYDLPMNFFKEINMKNRK